MALLFRLEGRPGRAARGGGTRRGKRESDRERERHVCRWAVAFPFSRSMLLLLLYTAAFSLSKGKGAVEFLRDVLGLFIRF